MLNVYLSGEIHTDWRNEIILLCEKEGLAINFSFPNTNHDSSDTPESKPTSDNKCETSDKDIDNKISDTIEMDDNKDNIDDEVKEDKNTLIDNETTDETN